MVYSLSCYKVWKQKVLSNGHFGKVYKGTIPAGYHKRRNVAVKILNAERNDDSASIQEINRMKNLDHPNVIKLLATVDTDDHNDPRCSCSWELENMTWMVMEYIPGGNLREHLVARRGGLQGDVMIKIAYDVALGMDYLHRSANLVHKDLAARNILVRTDNSVKIADFGICCELDDEAYFEDEESNKRIPVRWMPPESLPIRYEQTPRYSSKTDVWSFGVVLFEIWSRGEVPFAALTSEQVIKTVYYEDKDVLNYTKKGIRAWVKGLMCQCFRVNKDDRPDFRKIYGTIQQYL